MCSDFCRGVSRDRTGEGTGLCDAQSQRIVCVRGAMTKDCRVRDACNELHVLFVCTLLVSFEPPVIA